MLFGNNNVNKSLVSKYLIFGYSVIKSVYILLKCYFLSGFLFKEVEAIPWVPK